MKRALTMLFVLMTTCAVFAESVFTVSSSDLKLYDAEGKEMTLTDQVAQMVGQGWIIQSNDKEIVITTPIGTVVLGPDSTLVTETLTKNAPSLYLVDGVASFSTEQDFTGTLTVSTPATRFQATGRTGFILHSTEEEESVAVLKGTVVTVNGLTGKKNSVGPSSQYNLENDTVKPFTPEENAFKQIAVDDLQPVIAPVTTASSVPPAPASPKATTVPAPPTKPAATVRPYEGSEMQNIPFSPPEPQFLSVTSVALVEESKGPGVPPSPGSLQVGSVKPQYRTTFVITITPMMPDEPAFKPTKIRVLQIENAAEASPAVQQVPLQEQIPAVPKQTSTLTTSVSKRPVTVGIEGSYQFNYEQTGSMLHTVSIKPFLVSDNFSMKLALTASMHDLSSFTSNVTSFPHDTPLQSVASIFSYLDGMTIGKPSGIFYFSVDRKNHHTQGLSLSSGNVIETETKNAFLSLKLSSVTLRLSFQDLSMKNLLSQRYQYGNVSFTYAPDAKSMNMSLGTLYRLNALDSASAYPYFEVSQPLVETRLFSMRLLFGLDTYLPVYPQVDFTGIYNASGSAMFPNYNIVGGFSFNSWQITAKLLASHHKGENYPLVNSEFTANQVDTSYASSMDVIASLDWEGKAVSARLMYEQPLDFDGGVSRSTLNADTSKGADYLEAGLGISTGIFSLKLGYAIYGIAETAGTAFYDGNYVALSGTITCTLGDLSISLGTRKPAGSNPLYGFFLCSYTLQRSL
jgi:hypothetical protein